MAYEGLAVKTDIKEDEELRPVLLTFKKLTKNN